VKDAFPFQGEPHVHSAGIELAPPLALPDSDETPDADVFPPSLTPELDTMVEPDAPLPDADDSSEPEAVPAEVPAPDEAEPVPDPKEPDEPLDAA
jgi:hypothetical protein